MGVAAEMCAERHSVSREEQDRYAVQSYTRSIEATENGVFAKEIVPVEVKSRRATTVVEKDEELSKVAFLLWHIP